jgi:hypothetical protein
MTVDEVRAERDRLASELRATVVPLIEAFEARTGVLANVGTRHLNITTMGERRARWAVSVHVDLDWEA